MKFIAGTVINEGKSSIFMAHLDPNDLHLMTIRFIFLIRDLDDGLKYLGFPLNPNDYRKKD